MQVRTFWIIHCIHTGMYVYCIYCLFYVNTLDHFGMYTLCVTLPSISHSYVGAAVGENSKTQLEICMFWQRASQLKGRHQRVHMKIPLHATGTRYSQISSPLTTTGVRWCTRSETNDHNKRKKHEGLVWNVAGTETPTQRRRLPGRNHTFVYFLEHAAPYRLPTGAWWTWASTSWLCWWMTNLQYLFLSLSLLSFFLF